MTQRNKKFYSITEVAQLLDVSKTVIASRVNAGELKAHRISGKTIRISQDNLDSWLDKTTALAR
jgi:excisionase family DNA binding protein